VWLAAHLEEGDLYIVDARWRGDGTSLDPSHLRPSQGTLVHSKATKKARKKALQRFICEEGFLEAAMGSTIPNRYVNAVHHECDDSHQAAARASLAGKERLQWTKTGADRHQEQSVTCLPDRYRE
jgi:hypothetical protein